MQIPITKTVFDAREKELIVKPLESGWVVQGPYTAQFEKVFAAWTKAPHAIAVSNCTTALHLGLDALGIGPGDKVVVPAFTYVASANSVTYTGAEPVFCDIDLKTFNIDTTKLEALVKSDPTIKAIMPVHLFGLCANMSEVMGVAKAHNLKVIEDAACGFDAWIGNQHAGTFGHCGCFSFHPRKSITTGEGGMIVTSDSDLSAKVSSLRDHGAAKSDLARHKEKGGSLLPDFPYRGYNYRMTDFQGALGVAQMEKARQIVDGRRQMANRLTEALKNISSLETPFVPQGHTHGWQSFVCLYTDGEQINPADQKQVDRLNIRRNGFMEKLEKAGIATRQGTHAVHTLGYYADRYALKESDFPSAYTADRLSITLPLYATMTDEEFDYLVEQLKKAL